METARFESMNERQELILKALVEEYIRTAEPVSSKILVEHYDLDVSSATVRNDLAELEAAGFIRQPHTSAGRVPTEGGYQEYLRKLAPQKVNSDRTTSRKLREAITDSPDPEETMRALTKELVRLSGDMAIAAFGPDRSFFTGMGTLMAKPDFQDLDVVRSMSQMLDRFDEVVEGVFAQLAEEPQVMLGHDNPFGKDTAAVVVKCRLPNGRIGLLGLVGPMRMDYPKNLSLIEEVIDILKE